MGNAQCGGGDDPDWPNCQTHQVHVVSTELLRVAGISAFHTSIIVDDSEYFFDREGIMKAPPFWSHQSGRPRPGEPMEVQDMGRCTVGGDALVHALSPFFTKYSYDIFHKNCNTFVDAALYFLMRRRLPGRYNRMERLILLTSPASTNLLNQLFRSVYSQDGDQTMEVYATNPAADGFSVDDVIAELDDREDNEISGDSSEESASECSDDGHGCCYKPRRNSAVRRALVAHPAPPPQLSPLPGVRKDAAGTPFEFHHTPVVAAVAWPSTMPAAASAPPRRQPPMRGLH